MIGQACNNIAQAHRAGLFDQSEDFDLAIGIDKLVIDQARQILPTRWQTVVDLGMDSDLDLSASVCSPRMA